MPDQSKEMPINPAKNAERFTGAVKNPTSKHLPFTFYPLVPIVRATKVSSRWPLISAMSSAEREPRRPVDEFFLKLNTAQYRIGRA